jgi:uncharacterized protein (DUF433 family)
MFMTDLLEELRSRGASSEELFHDFPALAAAVMNQPLSTAQPDPDVPDAYAMELMDRRA